MPGSGIILKEFPDLGLLHRLSAAFDVEFLVDVVKMLLYGIQRHKQFIGDLFISHHFRLFIYLPDLLPEP
jgi:hypothetical protein